MQPVLRMHMHCVRHARDQETQASNAVKAYDADESISTRFQTLAIAVV